MQSIARLFNQTLADLGFPRRRGHVCGYQFGMPHEEMRFWNESVGHVLDRELG